MKQAISIMELKEFVRNSYSEDNHGNVYLNQADRVPDETIMADEDTAGAHTLQVLTVMVETESDSILFEYPFNEATELEEIHAQLEELYQFYPKTVIEVKLMDEKVRAHKARNEIVG